MDELDCATPEHYIEKAVELATNPTRSAGIKQTLKEIKKTSPLFDTKGFVGRLEEALLIAWKQHYANRPLADITIDSQ